MKKNMPLFIFIAAQLASVAILSLWILWYFSFRRHIFALGHSYGSVPTYQASVLWLLQGIFLMMPIIGGVTAIFIYWAKSKVLDNMRTNFISSVTHELLTPLASLKLYIETMLIRDIDEAKRKEFLQLMVEDSDRLATLIAKILIASRVETKKAIYHFEEIDLTSFIENFLAKKQARLKDVKLEVDLQPDCPAKIDSDSFTLILKNLFENAVRYSRAPASISISLSCQKKTILLTFSDKGDGLEKYQLKRIFRMFYRVTRKKKGTGLGLYIVKDIVKAHRGKVWAESTGLGTGSVFKITLPKAK